jgi:hypothetical protein
MIKNHQLGLLFALENNRLVSIETNQWLPIQSLDLPQEGLEVWLRFFGYVKVFRTRLTNQPRHDAIDLPNDELLAFFERTPFTQLHEQHWQIEQYHRMIKPVCHLEPFQVRSKNARCNHILSSLCG